MQYPIFSSFSREKVLRAHHVALDLLILCVCVLCMFSLLLFEIFCLLYFQKRENPQNQMVLQCFQFSTEIYVFVSGPKRIRS